MSRRKRTPRRDSPGSSRLAIECDGREDHPVERIARVQIKPRPDLPDLNNGYAVTVEYVRADQDPEDNNYTLAVRGDHMTRRFVCATCGRDVPISDSNLVKVAQLLEGLGQGRLRLREVPTIVCRE